MVSGTQGAAQTLKWPCKSAFFSIKHCESPTKQLVKASPVRNLYVNLALNCVIDKPLMSIVIND